MLELNASSFLGAATNLARLNQILRQITDAHQDILIPASIAAISESVEAFKVEGEKLGARLACVSADKQRGANWTDTRDLCQATTAFIRAVPRQQLRLNGLKFSL
jgi:hypothetical protein